MEVKGISPLAAAPARRESGPAPGRASGHIANSLPKAADPSATGTKELHGALAEKLLESSGIKSADLHRFRVELDIDGDTGRIVAEIRNRQTGDLVEEVPSRSILRHAAMLKDTLGTLLDTPV